MSYQLGKSYFSLVPTELWARGSFREAHHPPLQNFHFSLNFAKKFLSFPENLPKTQRLIQWSWFEDGYIQLWRNMYEWREESLKNILHFYQIGIVVPGKWRGYLFWNGENIGKFWRLVGNSWKIVYPTFNNWKMTRRTFGLNFSVTFLGTYKNIGKWLKNAEDK